MDTIVTTKKGCIALASACIERVGRVSPVGVVASDTYLLRYIISLARSKEDEELHVATMICSNAVAISSRGEIRKSEVTLSTVENNTGLGLWTEIVTYESRSGHRRYFADAHYARFAIAEYIPSMGWVSIASRSEREKIFLDRILSRRDAYADGSSHRSNTGCSRIIAAGSYICHTRRTKNVMYMEALRLEDDPTISVLSRRPHMLSLDLESEVSDVAGIGEIIVAASCRFESSNAALTLTLHSLDFRDARWKDMLRIPFDGIGNRNNVLIAGSTDEGRSIWLVCQMSNASRRKGHILVRIVRVSPSKKSCEEVRDIWVASDELRLAWIIGKKFVLKIGWKCDILVIDSVTMAMKYYRNES